MAWFADSGTAHDCTAATIRQLAEMIIDVVGSKSKLVHEELPEDDPRQRCPDISLARAKLGWEPKVELREGLTKTIAFFEQELAFATAS